ncbi:CopG family ribbon-helix-helix protein [Natrinema hispanicum]|uniref:Transcriptional regulator, CopG family n=1 Tax=Natrinema hispanicum TaxID=392421 RepID=A0A1I0JGQ2_9EURY|nr:CopG family ribbon-helix-helix protein [Natrinema hispanicum]SDD62221.1 transcriptional regulator, CopG family [Natrinema hispanicum]SEU09351.1 transcriptional regulator, CopG family [Natrinema hispanicum]
MGIVSVSMPEDLLKKIDELVEVHDYSGRSEVFREAGRKLIREFQDQSLENRELIAIVTALFPYDSRAVETKMTELRHTHADAVRSNSHSCICDDRGCVETFIIEGDLTDVSEFVRDVEATNEDVQVEYSLFPVDSIQQPTL